MVSGVLILIIVAFIALISFQNATVVIVSLMHCRFETTLTAVIFISVLSGVVVAQLVRQWAQGRIATFRNHED